jgi:hypothetical protein
MRDTRIQGCAIAAPTRQHRLAIENTYLHKGKATHLFEAKQSAARWFSLEEEVSNRAVRLLENHCDLSPAVPQQAD